jgi:hypothetical protein
MLPVASGRRSATIPLLDYGTVARNLDRMQPRHAVRRTTAACLGVQRFASAPASLARSRYRDESRCPESMYSNQIHIALNRFDHRVHPAGQHLLGQAQGEALWGWNGTCDGRESAKRSTTASTITGPSS